ncbi:hypothetical protein J6590_005985 [Homalodisca vitripennis]|nr:hypothetical protein J6590_005985 [Homalodisca vitripennis]
MTFHITKAREGRQRAESEISSCGKQCLGRVNGGIRIREFSHVGAKYTISPRGNCSG